MAKKETITVKILAYLREHPSANVKSIAIGIEKKYSIVSSYLQRMQKADLVKKIAYGKYSASDKGLTYLSEILKEDVQLVFKGDNQEKQQGTTINDYDLESVDTILMLKQKYGKRKLLGIIEKIRKVIE